MTIDVNAFVKDDNGYTYHAAEGSPRQRVYIIPEKNLPTFQDKLNKLAKRAVKLQLEVPSYTQVHEDYVSRKVETGEDDEHCNPVVKEILIKRVWIVLHHPQVIVSGFEFLSALEHTIEGNILHTLIGKAVPPQYRDCEPNCDHCKLDRRRKETFILQEVATGNYLQVGRQCLADFLGRSAENAAYAAEMYASLGELAEASEEYGGGGCGTSYEMLDRYLAYVAEVISCVGWKSRSSAREYGGSATADIAMSEMYKRRYDPHKDLFDRPTEKSHQTAKAAIEWAENLPDSEVETSDYLWNVRVVARRGVVGSRQFGIAASIVSSHQKHLGELKRKERQVSKPSEWVGEVGKRQVFNLLVEKVITCEGMYTSFLHLMSDDVGNRFVWFSSSETFEAGKHVLLRGTIKAHNERQGVKQNLLSRCEKVKMETYLFTHRVEGKADATFEVEAVSEKEAKAKLFGTLNVKRMPKGMTVEVKKPEPALMLLGSTESEKVRQSVQSDEEYEARCESEEARRYEERAYGRD